MLKDRTLMVQIWVMFTSMMLFILLILGVAFQLVISAFFTNDIYEQMEEAQSQFLHFQETQRPFKPTLGEKQFREDSIRISHLLITVSSNEQTPFPPFLNKEEVMLQASRQKEKIARYTSKEKDISVHYIIQKVNEDYLVTFASPKLKGQLTKELFSELMLFVFALFIVSFPLSAWIAKRLTKPLMTIEEHVNELANRNWHQPLLLERKDEVGKLALSIEKLRKRLVKHDEKQQNYLQHMSHELKTPVMIIQSYMQAMEDGIYPKGDMQTSVKVVQTEIDRLNKRIQSLLYLTRLNHLEVEKLEKETFHVQELIDNVVDKFRFQNQKIEWHMNVEDVVFYGDKEQFQILFENLIQNQIRYAKNKIMVGANIEQNAKKNHLSIVIENDGVPIEAADPQLLFEPFYKGEKGQFGLGLAIVKNITLLHDGTIYAENRKNGVCFTLHFPLYN